MVCGGSPTIGSGEAPLEADNIRVLTPNLPSQRSSSAGLADDAMRFAELSVPARVTPPHLLAGSHTGSQIGLECKLIGRGDEGFEDAGL
jgi:hypothetical protein